MRLGPCLLLMLLSSGCLPYIVPPTQLSAGVGPSTGYVGDRSVREPGSTVHYNLRAGLHPLSAIESLRSRRVDVGVGYSLERGNPGEAGSRLLHGPYLEVDAFALPAAESGASLRAGARLTGDLLFSRIDGEGRTGGAAMLAGLVEWVDYGLGEYESDDGDTSVIGVRAGELSIGGFLGVSRVVIADQSYLGGVVGLSVRIPFLAGIICCSLGGDSDDSGSGSSSGGSSSDSSSGSGSPDREPARPSPGHQPARPSR